jgi:protein-S-isoprenylcysteine O-methyltransferase Ste14
MSTISAKKTYKRPFLLLVLVIESLILSLVLFLVAGTLYWLYGWLFLILLYSCSFIILMWVLRHNPGLIEERMGLKSNEPTWDKEYVIVLSIVVIIWWVSVPLDAVRFHWSQMPAWLHFVGAIVLLSSFYLMFLIYRENPYLSSAVHIQEDRGQTVVSTGPYRYVRHPFYTSTFLFVLGSALLMGSWIGVILGLFIVGILARRAVREECVLQKGLKGYDAYMAQVKYRLIPHVW